MGLQGEGWAEGHLRSGGTGVLQSYSDRAIKSMCLGAGQPWVKIPSLLLTNYVKLHLSLPEPQSHCL